MAPALPPASLHPPLLSDSSQRLGLARPPSSPVFCVSPPRPLALSSLSCILEGPKAEWRSR